MKLIVDITEGEYATLKDFGEENLGYYHRIILHGTPLSEELENEEVNEVLDKVRADVINIAEGKLSIKVRSVLKIIDKHKAGGKIEADN